MQLYLKCILTNWQCFPRSNPRTIKAYTGTWRFAASLECAKNDAGLSGLKVLKPLLVKLPDDLQGRWQRQAYRYKVQKAADYPPIYEFAKFIQEVSQERNNPYLAIENLDRRNLRPSRFHFKPPKSPNTGEDFTLQKLELSGNTHANDQPPSGPGPGHIMPSVSVEYWGQKLWMKEKTCSVNMVSTSTVQLLPTIMQETAKLSKSAENARATNTQQHFIQTLQTIQWFAVRSKETPSFMVRRPATSQPHVPRRVAVQAEANRALRYSSQTFTQ